MTAAAVLGTMAAASSLLFVWPQVVKLARTRDVDGVSVPATLFAMAGYSIWMLYGVREGLPFVFAANLQAVIGFGLVVVMAASHRRVEPRVWPGAAAGLAFILVVFAAVPPALGGLAVLVSSIGFVPQAVVAVREPDLSGLSIWTYVLIALSTSVWAAYGLAEGDPYLVAPTLVILPSALTIAVRIRLTASPVDGPVDLAVAD
jgi:uncharacterized protein with PQ loop repeat